MPKAENEELIRQLNNRNVQTLADAKKAETLPPPKRSKSVHPSLLSRAKAKPIKGIIPLRLGVTGALIARTLERNQS